MTVDKMIMAFEAYYQDTYPAIVKGALLQKYRGWSQDGLDQLYSLAIQKVSRSYKMAPDLAQLITLEEEALDQRDLVRIGSKPIPGQLQISGITPERAEENQRELERLLEELAKKLKGRRNEHTSPE